MCISYQVPNSEKKMLYAFGFILLPQTFEYRVKLFSMIKLNYMIL